MYLCRFFHLCFCVTYNLCSGLLWCDLTFSCIAFTEVLDILVYGNTNYFKSTFIQIKRKKTEKTTSKGDRKFSNFEVFKVTT